MAKSKSLVKDYMTKNVVTVSPQTTTSEVIKLMKESDHNSYPVVENNKLVGMVTSFDIVVKDWADHVSELMSTKLVVANENLSINDASRVMFRRGISRMPVINEKGEIVDNVSGSLYRGFRPVISLNRNVLVTGTGTIDDPYVVS